MDLNQTSLSLAVQFGQLVKARRTRLKMSQDDLAFASGVGRRFIIELERGKPTCQLGPSLMVLATLGIYIPEVATLAKEADQSRDLS